MNEEFLEREGDEPEGWETNVIMRRGANGKMVVLAVQDDMEEVKEDAIDNTD